MNNISVELREFNLWRRGESSTHDERGPEPKALGLLIEAAAAALDGLPDGALDGGWTAAGLSAYAQGLEAKVAALQTTLAQLLACHDGGAICNRYEKESLMANAWQAARKALEATK